MDLKMHKGELLEVRKSIRREEGGKDGNEFKNGRHWTDSGKDWKSTQTAVKVRKSSKDAAEKSRRRKPRTWAASRLATETNLPVSSSPLLSSILAHFQPHLPFSPTSPWFGLLLSFIPLSFKFIHSFNVPERFHTMENLKKKKKKVVQRYVDTSMWFNSRTTFSHYFNKLK